MTEDVFKLSEKAADIILSLPKTSRIRIISHYDADGITSASIISKSLYREGYDFHTTLMRNPFIQGLERIKKEENNLIIFLDMGSGQIDMIKKFNCKTIIIDHHQTIKSEKEKNILQINANQCGINGNYEACGASLSYSVAKSINSKNKDLVPLAIVGVTGDKQFIGGIRGYNKIILDEAIKKGYLKKITGMKLYGQSLFDALYYSTDPYFSNLSGNKEKIHGLLEKLNLDEKVKINEISKEKNKQLYSFLFLHLLKKNCEKNILDTIIRKRYWSDMLQCELERFADLLDSCGKGGNRGLGLPICWGDRKSFNEAVDLEKKYKQKILDELIKLDRQGFQEMKGYKYFYSTDSSLGGVIGGIAINFILGRNKPLISLVKKENEIHISCRGNQFLVKKGLNLGLAMKKAASKLGGNGGGHRIAAGATINSDQEKEFLDTVNNILTKQMGL